MSRRGAGRAPLWRLRLAVPWNALHLFETAIEAEALATSAQALPGDGGWLLDGLYAAPPPEAAIRTRLAVAAAAAGAAAPEIQLTPVPDVDWVTLSLAELPAVQAGPYYVAGAHAGAPPAGARFPLRIEAGPAFGTGQHETTRGCLLALHRLSRGRRFQAPLDMGCGSGILALAMAATWRRPVLASDIDPLSVTETARNARRNGLEAWVRAQLADGFRHRTFRGRRFDLITANILARPLVALAPQMRRHAEAGAVLVLSGLLNAQERQVLSAYRSQGFRLAQRIRVGDWPTLILRRRRQAT